MSSLKLYLDEHVSHRLAAQLQQYGFDVTSAYESGMGAATDDVLLAFAVSEQRTVVTFNHKDFAILHAQYMAEGKEHAGIIFSTEETPDVIRRRLLRLLNTLSANELTNQIRWLNDFK
jgi:predicted nuclease of predicted toxin-antitoxin system